MYVAKLGLPCRKAAPLVEILLRRGFANRIDTSATYANAPAPAVSIDAVISPSVDRIASEICGLDMLQAAQLVSVLKKKLNLPDVPMMQHGFAPQNTSDTQTTTANAQTAPAVNEKTEFALTLEKIDPASKAKVIREIKTVLPQLNLVEAKTFVESAPKLIKDKIKKADAEKIKAALEAAGATISMS